MNHLLELALLTLGAFFANALSAMAGGGAGLLQLPLLLAFGLPFSVALATHKVASVFLGVGVGLGSTKSVRFTLPYAILLLGAGLPGVWLGTHLIVRVPDGPAQIILGIMTIGLGLYNWQHKTLGLTITPRDLSFAQWCLGAAVIAGIGVLNGSFTSGTGLFVTLWLVRYYGFDLKTATAYTLFFVGLFWNGMGAASLAVLSSVQLSYLPGLIVGSVVGGYYGVRFAARQSNAFVKRLFTLLTISVGLVLALKGIVAL